MSYDSTDWFRSGAHLEQQRRAQQRQQAQQQATQDAIRRSLSIYEKRPTAPDLETITGRKLPIGEMPEVVRHQLDQTRGDWGNWLRAEYSEREREHWWAEWMRVSPIGQAVAAVMEEQQRAAQEAEERARDEAMHRRADERVRREMQERYRLSTGTVVRVKAPRSEHDGRVAAVASMEMVGTTLMAKVVIDPLPPEHPLVGRPVQFRPLHLLPIVWDLPAQDLVVLARPEDLGRPD
jgi:hypothetical protein